MRSERVVSVNNELSAMLLSHCMTGPTGFLPGISRGGAKFIVTQISFVMLIFLLFSEQISEGTKFSEGEANCLRGPGGNDNP